ncbi:hypothetical protein [Legionella cincinnatiensis]|uniref:Coiled-coil protein n=1 Tax=Legionella cincinnatiensis TaxID=28085 RepID=A0A378IMK0_9GAMM|nr:hypothetical protein [Legionella cincinnatiensis]KTC83888.1 coiled-coil protein [Legionella cincinnatiensis]STX36180.1 coiled-coil protein [Legionella cincinnatiensis]
MSSKLGFIAIDIDGTTLVEKIDKNPLYGWRNTESNIRSSLKEYMKWAQEKGYDIIILTARPEIVEPALKNIKLGTLPTMDILQRLVHEENITIKQIARAPAGLKGAKMQELLTQYQNESKEHENAIGILFDDQLKQVHDVKKQNNPQLLAFDINSKVDLEQFADIVELPGTHACHPYAITLKVLTEHSDLFNLKASINKLDPNQHFEVMNLLNHVVDDLCIRIDEARLHDYKPEIKWVETTVRHMHSLIDKIYFDTQELTCKDLKSASKEIFGHANPDKVKPNSRCDKLVQSMLLKAMEDVQANELQGARSRFENIKQKLMGIKKENQDIELKVEENLGGIKPS